MKNYALSHQECRDIGRTKAVRAKNLALTVCHSCYAASRAAFAHAPRNFIGASAIIEWLGVTPSPITEKFALEPKPVRVARTGHSTVLLREDLPWK